MKKFSKLILETKKELWNKHPLVSPVDWDEIFNPLIEHIDSNLKANVPPPGDGIFGSNTKAALDELIDAISEDYVDYFKNVVDDGSKGSLFNAYSINVDYRDLIDCIQPILDRTNDFDDYPNWDGGYFYIALTNLKYENLEDFIEDIEDIHLKMKMLNIDYTIKIDIDNRNYVNLIKMSKNISKQIKDLTELPGSSSGNSVKSIKEVSFFIYNKETVQVGDLD